MHRFLAVSALCVEILALSGCEVMAPTADGNVSNVRMDVASYRHHEGTIPSNIIFVGEAINNSNVRAGSIDIVISLVDEQGHVLAAGGTNIAERLAVQPGEKYPFVVVVDKAPKQWHRERIQIHAKAFDLANQVQIPHTGLELQDVALHKPGEFSGHASELYRLTGMVANIGDSEALWVKVIGIAYDSGGKVLDVADDVPDLPHIPPWR